VENQLVNFDFANAVNIESQTTVTIKAESASPLAINAPNFESEYLKDKSLLLYMPMDDRKTIEYDYGTTKIDATTNIVDSWSAGFIYGTVSNGVSGAVDQAYEFSDGYIKSPLFNANLLEARKSGYSYSARIQIAPGSGDSTILASGLRHTITTHLYIENNKLNFSYKSDEGATITVAGNSLLQQGEWYHVGAVYDPNTHSSTIFLNGEIEASVTASSPLGYKTYGLDLYVGKQPGAYGQFKGKIDDVFVYQKSLSPISMRQLYDRKTYAGSVTYKTIPLSKTFNTVNLSLSESNSGATQVSLWQDNQWHKLDTSSPTIFDMAKRQPISSAKLKIEFLANTSLTDMQLEFANVNYTGTANKFTFMFMGDDNGYKGADAIKEAFTENPNIALLFSVPDNGFGGGLANNYSSYANSWQTAPSTDSRYLPIYSGLGNHDVEHPDDVNYAVEQLGTQVPFSLPGMRNYREGPFDTYANGYKDERLNYSFDYKNTHFLMLNGYFRDLALKHENGEPNDRFIKGYGPTSHVSEEMLQWVEESLSNSSTQHKFVFFHEGAFPPPGQRHETDSLDDPKNPGNSGPDDSRPMRDRLWTLFAKYGVTATMIGHNHTPSQSWVADPSGQYQAVYELEPGKLQSQRRFSLIDIDGDKATVKFYVTDLTTGQLTKTVEDLIIDKSTSQKYPPKLQQFEAIKEQRYGSIEKDHFYFEVGSSIGKYSQLYFEARDNDVSDQLTFSFQGLKEFLIANQTLNANKINQFRRTWITSSTFTEENIGTYPITISVTDGLHTDSKQIKITVLPKEDPIVLGSIIKNGSELTQVRDVGFVCLDNSSISDARTYEHINVIKDGSVFTRNDGWRPIYNKLNDQLIVEGIQFVAQKVPAGQYTVTVQCKDSQGASSIPYSTNFKVIDDGVPLDQSKPWIDGVWPLTGDVETLNRISIWPQSNNGSTKYLYAETGNTAQLVDEQGRAIAFEVANFKDNPDVKVFGPLDILIKENLEIGTYTLTITPRSSETIIGEPETFTFNVTNAPVSPSIPESLPAAPSSLQVKLNLKAPTLPITDNNLTIEALTATSARLVWSNLHGSNTTGVGYNIYRNGELIASIPIATSYLDINLDPALQYSYQVVAFNASGEISDKIQTTPLTWPEESNRTIYVDNSLSENCLSSYSITERSCGAGVNEAYSTLTQVANIAKKGTHVILRAGTFNETIAPKYSGESGSPIIFSNYQDELVTITAVTGQALQTLPIGENPDMHWEKFGFYLWEKSFITIDGITFDDLSGWGRLVSSNNIIIKNNTLTNANTPGSRASIKLISSHYNQVINNTISIGHDNVFLLRSNHNLVANNNVTSGRHTLWTIKSGSYNVIRDNFFSNELEKIGEIFDAHDLNNGEDERHFNLTKENATKFNLVEGNRFAYTPPVGAKGPFSGIQYAGQNGIIRNNHFYDNTGPGLVLAQYPDEAKYTNNNRIYHNNFVKNHFAGINISNSLEYQISDNIIKNNIFYQNDFQDHDKRFYSWAELDMKPVQILLRRENGVFFDNNNIFNSRVGEDYVISGIYFNDSTPREPVKSPLATIQPPYKEMFANNLESSPNFVDLAERNFNLTASSPMIDAASFLTTAKENGSGVTLKVLDASYFFDGYGVPGQQGDLIQLENSDKPVRIISIDYSTNSLTLNEPLTWVQGQGVSLTYSKNAPDIGALEHR